jgi:uncharacterized RDD family membrane protein YckC
MPRFDEIELEPVVFGGGEPADVAAAVVSSMDDEPDEFAPAPRLRRMFALFIDLSLFAALAVALSPLLPSSMPWTSLAALGGFVLLVSFYYFVTAWMLWGRTIGGAIFDVRVAADFPPIALRNATLRWLAMYLSLATGGLGFLLALLPSRRSLADRLSATRCVRA